MRNPRNTAGLVRHQGVDAREISLWTVVGPGGRSGLAERYEVDEHQTANMRLHDRPKSLARTYRVRLSSLFVIVSSKYCLLRLTIQTQPLKVECAAPCFDFIGRRQGSDHTSLPQIDRHYRRIIKTTSARSTVWRPIDARRKTRVVIGPHARVATPPRGRPMRADQGGRCERAYASSTDPGRDMRPLAGEGVPHIRATIRKRRWAAASPAQPGDQHERGAIRPTVTRMLKGGRE